jgi:hypothetical protein
LIEHKRIERFALVRLPGLVFQIVMPVPQGGGWMEP